jgi:hypothetical protein
LGSVRGVFVGGLCLLLGACSTIVTPPAHRPARDINAVLTDHDAELMAIPGVVGVYVGLLGDGKTPCLKVMLSRSDPRLEQSLPRTLEGYRVVPEVTGEIRPMGTRN